MSEIITSQAVRTCPVTMKRCIAGCGPGTCHVIDSAEVIVQNVRKKTHFYSHIKPVGISPADKKGLRALIYKEVIDILRRP